MPRKRLFQNREFIGFVIEKQQAELLRDIAKAENISVSELCRRIIAEWLEEARVRYGLQFQPAAAEVVPSGSALAPLVEKRMEDVVRALAEVKPAVREAAQRLPELRRRVEELLGELERLRRLRRAGVVIVDGKVVSADEVVREREGLLEEELSKIKEEVRRIYRVRSRFFREVYARWEKVRREVPAREAWRVESEVALVLRWLDRVDPQLRELWRMLRRRG
jgi:hypothetical protein